MSHELGHEVSLEDARDALLTSLAETFHVEVHTSPARQIA
jgi:hypothetical protein